MRPLVVAAVVAFAGCKSHAPGVVADFDHDVQLVEAHVTPDTARRGDHVQLAFTWRCEKPPGAGWQLLTHVEDPTGRADNLDFLGPLRESADGSVELHQPRGPDTWEAGKTYSETLDYRVSTSFAKGPLTVYVGLFKGPHRMHVVSGRTDGHDRVIAGTIALAD